MCSSDLLFDELSYYEQIGKYKLADSIYERLVKIAKQAKPGDIGGEGFGEAWSKERELLLFNDLIITIPECNFLFSFSAEAKAFILGDYKDCLSQQPDPSSDQARKNCQELAKKALIEGSLAKPVFEIHCEEKIPARRAKRLIPLIMIHCLRFILTPSLKFANAYTYSGHLRYFHGRHCRNRSASRPSCNWLRCQCVSTNEHAITSARYRAD